MRKDIQRTLNILGRLNVPMVIQYSATVEDFNAVIVLLEYLNDCSIRVS